MSHFYAEILTSTRKTAPSAQGSVKTGITAYCASYEGRIVTNLWQDSEGIDRFEVTMEAHLGKGDRQMIASGIVGDAEFICAIKGVTGPGLRIEI